MKKPIEPLTVKTSPRWLAAIVATIALVLAPNMASFAEPYSLLLSVEQQLAGLNDTAIFAAVLQPLMLNARQVAALLGISKSLFHQLVRSGQMPLGRRISRGRVAWIVDDVKRWVASRPESTDPVRTVQPKRDRTTGASKAQA